MKEIFLKIILNQKNLIKSNLSILSQRLTKGSIPLISCGLSVCATIATGYMPINYFCASVGEIADPTITETNASAEIPSPTANAAG